MSPPSSVSSQPPVPSRLPPPPRAPRIERAKRRGSEPSQKAASAVTVPALRAARPPSSAPPTLRKPRLPPEYVIGRLVHQGRACDVWTGADGACRPVAVKIAAAQSPVAAARIAAEARALAMLTHRSIVRMIDHGTTDDGRAYLVLEWLKGERLSELIRARGAGLSPRDAVRLLMPIAGALALAHDRGMIHGDVRAEHVLIVPVDRSIFVPKLIDFGATQPLRSSAAGSEPPESSPSVQRPAVGADPTVDVRGLAATIFHALSGHPPFAEEGPEPIVPGMPRTGLSERDAVLWRVLAQGLAPEPRHRPRTPRDFARDLAGWAGLRGVETDITGSPIQLRWGAGPEVPAPSRRGQR